MQLNWASQLLNQWDVRYTGQQWQADLIVQGYQTQHISESSSGVQNQYQRLPELDFIGGKDYFWHSADAEFEAQVVNFDYSSDYQPYTYQQLVLREPTSHLQQLSGSLIRRHSPRYRPGLTIYSAELATESPDQSGPISSVQNITIFDVIRLLFWAR